MFLVMVTSLQKRPTCFGIASFVSVFVCMYVLMCMCLYDKEEQQINCQLQNKLRCGGFAIHGRITTPAKGIEKDPGYGGVCVMCTAFSVPRGARP